MLDAKEFSNYLEKRFIILKQKVPYFQRWEEKRLYHKMLHRDKQQQKQLELLQQQQEKRKKSEELTKAVNIIFCLVVLNCYYCLFRVCQLNYNIVEDFQFLWFLKVFVEDGRCTDYLP